MKKQPRVGVIGTGRFGQNHVRLYKDLPECQLVGIYDINIAQGMDVGAQYNVPVFPTAESLLKEVEMISVVTPTATHFDVALAPLQLGIDTLIEKPICVSMQQADKLLQTANETGASISIGFLERFNPAFSQTRNSLNEITSFKAQRLGPWVGRKVTVDVISDLMVHDLDLLNLIDDSPIVDIEAVGSRVESDYIDRAEVRLELESGLVAELVSDRANADRFRELEIKSPEKQFRLDMIEQKLLSRKPTSKDWHIFDNAKAEPLKEELKAFVTGSSPKPADGLAGKEALKMVLAIQQALGS